MGHLLGGDTVKMGCWEINNIADFMIFKHSVTVRFAENTSPMLVFMQKALTDSRTWPDAAS